jgi:hypothetical protein
MCGNAGLFAGCELAPICAARRGSGGASTGHEATRYRSAFNSWDTLASARNAPRRLLGEAGDDLAPPVFPLALVPFAGHPLVGGLGPGAVDFLLARHTLRYLEFTAKLEHLVVNGSVLSIAHGVCGVDLPDQMRLDAYRIYCDEGYHALFCADLVRQIESRTGVRRNGEHPYFLTALDRIVEGVEPEQRALTRMLFVIVSETLITASLTETARPENMDPGLRSSLQDHASDEGRHHVYFATYLKRLWTALDARERDLAARLLPDLLGAFLLPDFGGIRADLREAGLSGEEAEAVTADIYPPSVIHAHLRNSSVKTVHYFRSLGALDDRAGEEWLTRATLQWFPTLAGAGSARE